MRKGTIGAGILAAAAVMMLAVTACGTGKGDQTTAAAAESAAAESAAAESAAAETSAAQTTAAVTTAAETSAAETSTRAVWESSEQPTDEGDEDVVYDTLSPEEEASQEAEEASIHAEEDQTEAKVGEIRVNPDGNAAAENAAAESAAASDEQEEPAAEAADTQEEDPDAAPSGKAKTVKKNKAAGVTKPDSTVFSGEPQQP